MLYVNTLLYSYQRHQILQDPHNCKITWFQTLPREGPSACSWGGHFPTKCMTVCWCLSRGVLVRCHTDGFSSCLLCYAFVLWCTIFTVGSCRKRWLSPRSLLNVLLFRLYWAIVGFTVVIQMFLFYVNSTICFVVMIVKLLVYFYYVNNEVFNTYKKMHDSCVRNHHIDTHT